MRLPHSRSLLQSAPVHLEPIAENALQGSRADGWATAEIGRVLLIGKWNIKNHQLRRSVGMLIVAKQDNGLKMGSALRQISQQSGDLRV